MAWKRFVYIMIIVLVAGVSALGGALAGGWAVYQAVQDGVVSTAPNAGNQADFIAAANELPNLTFNTTEIQTTITRTVEQVAPAVVTVIATIPGQRTIFGMTADQTVSGSGVFITPNGYLLTNHHVVEGAREVSIVLADGSQRPVTVVGTDKYADLAVLKADGTLPGVAELGNSDVLNPGETVIAIGSPLGNFKNSVTVGVVSATGRSIDTGEGYLIENLIQTDAAINSGNSGGPLLNLAGEVVGINALVVRNSSSGTVAEGLGFAIPINTARVVAEQIIQKGYFARPYLGITWQSITPRIAYRYNLPVDYGAYVTEVWENSPASQAGIRRGDIITRIGEVTLDENHAYINTLFLHQPGEVVIIEVMRGNNRVTMEVTLGESTAR